MKFWTIQTSNICDIIENDGIFYPDFQKSRYTIGNEKLKKLYYFFLHSFNKVNNTKYDGLIFSFVSEDDVNENSPFTYHTFNDFKEYMKGKKDVIGTLWQGINHNDYFVLELDLDESFNPLYIDYNDFQFLMPPCKPDPRLPYTKYSEKSLKIDIDKGKMPCAKYPSHVIQAHLPYIKIENVVKKYPLFSLD